MGRDCTFTSEQFLKLRILLANTPSNTVGEDAVLQPLFRKLTLTEAEKAQYNYKDVTGSNGQSFVQMDRVEVKRHFNTQQVRALVSVIWRPPEVIPWKVSEFPLKVKILEELGETINIPEDEDD